MLNNSNTNNHDSDNYVDDDTTNTSFICVALNIYGSQRFTSKMHNFALKCKMNKNVKIAMSVHCIKLC